MSQSELRTLIDAARAHGAIIRTVVRRDELIQRVQVRKGIPGCGPAWMPPLFAAERLREFVAEVAR